MFMYNQSKHKERKHFCMYCLQCFSSESILTKHTNNCLTINGKPAINMPKIGENIVKFNNYHKHQPVPFVIYADFEVITKKVQGCRPNDKESYTDTYQKHEDCGDEYKVVCCHNDKPVPNQSKHIRVKAPFTNSWKRCSKRLDIVKVLLRKDSTNH